MNREEFFKTTVNENRQRILRICRYYFPDPDQCADAFQDSLIRVWESLPGFRGDSLVSTWIYRIVVNVCLTSIRKDRRKNYLTTSISVLEQVTGRIAEEETLLSASEDKKIHFFRKFLENLTVADRTLVSLYLEDLSSREMSEITGISESNVRVRIYRIKEKIKQQWEENNDGTR